MAKLVLLLCLILMGCEMSTSEVVAKLDECRKNNLHADVYRLFGDSKVMDIQCVPNKEVKP